MNLTTRYLGMQLAHPIVASASPLSHTLDGVKLLAQAGASAIVMYSLFEEQMGQHIHLAVKYHVEDDSAEYDEVVRYFPNMYDYNVGPEEYLEQIRRAKEAVDVPIIGSLNVTSAGDWVHYARWVEQAGADALELNVYYVPARMRITSPDVEQRFVDVLCEAKKRVRIPIAMKLTPYLSAPADLARRLSECGADALVLFNRFYQPDIDLGTLTVAPRIALSRSEELRLPLHWIALLYKRVRADLAITTGVHTYEDVLKGLMAGAQATMMASALLRNGPSHIRKVLRDVEGWLEQHNFDDLSGLIGCMSEMDVVANEAHERANYIKTLNSWRANWR
jgi:dihydroorotate dehydrogenase (fumarate)